MLTGDEREVFLSAAAGVRSAGITHSLACLNAVLRPRDWRRRDGTLSPLRGYVFFVTVVAVWHNSDQGEEDSQTLLGGPNYAARKLFVVWMVFKEKMIRNRESIRIIFFLWFIENSALWFIVFFGGVRT